MNQIERGICMALTKDQVIVWMSLSRNENQNLFFLLAIPYSRVKDLDQRLQNAYQHKVKGNRLDDLDPELLDEKTLPFAESYLQGFFRIADLAGFGSRWFAKSPILETKVLEQAAGFLKIQFTGCQFVIRYEPKQFRSATLNTWIRKNQLPAILDADSMETLPARSSRFLGALLEQAGRSESGSEKTDAIRQLCDKLCLQVSMAPKWQIVNPEDVYLAMVPGKEKKNLKKLLAAQPQLIEQGIVDKWMKSKPAPGFFEKAWILAQSPQSKELLPALSASRIENQFEKLKSELEADQKPFPQDDFEAWVSAYSQHFLQIAPIKQTGLTHQAIVDVQKGILEEWIEKPKITATCKNSYYLAGIDEKLEILETPVMNVLLESSQSDSLFNPVILARKYQGLLTDLENFLDVLSWQHPLPRIYASGNVARWIRRWSIENNRFLMLLELDKKQKDLVRNYPGAGNDLSLWLEEHSLAHFAPVRWTDPRLMAGLHPDQIAFLASNLLDPAATRLLALAFFNGLDTGKARRCIVYSKGSLYSLVRSYVFSTREQNFLDTVHSPAIRMLLMRPALSLSKIRRLDEMAREGMSIVWLEANLKGNMNLTWLEHLARIYPWNNLPWQWRAFYEMPEGLAQWLLEKSKARNPRTSREALVQSLAGLNENADLILFKRLGQVHRKNEAYICSEKPGRPNQNGSKKAAGKKKKKKA